jgi:hypothetical protein
LKVRGGSGNLAAQLYDIPGCTIQAYSSGVALADGWSFREFDTPFVLPVGPSPSSLSLYLNGTSVYLYINAWEFY